MTFQIACLLIKQYKAIHFNKSDRDQLQSTYLTTVTGPTLSEKKGKMYDLKNAKIYSQQQNKITCEFLSCHLRKRDINNFKCVKINLLSDLEKFETLIYFPQVISMILFRLMARPNNPAKQIRFQIYESICISIRYMCSHLDDFFTENLFCLTVKITPSRSKLRACK